MKIVNGIAVLEDDSHISKWVEESNNLSHDWYLLDHVKPYIKPGMDIIECGSFIGDHSLFLSQNIGDGGTLHCFEANPRAFECLEHNMKDCTNSKLYNSPVSNVVADYFVTEINENTGMAVVDICTESTPADTPRIKSIVIDDLNIENVGLILIDCEGCEIDILSGLEKTIEKYSPTLIIEVNACTLGRVGLTKQDLLDKVTSLGYSYTNIYNWVPIKDEDIQFDIVCTKN